MNLALLCHYAHGGNDGDLSKGKDLPQIFF